MGWNNWNYWVKGIILTYLFVLLLLLISQFIPLNQIGMNTLQTILLFPGFFISYFIFPSCFPAALSALTDNCRTIQYLSIFIMSAIFYFLIGVIIGWIYGKIKERRQKNEQE